MAGLLTGLLLWLAYQLTLILIHADRLKDVGFTPVTPFQPIEDETLNG
jgi:hypothetical protein